MTTQRKKTTVKKTSVKAEKAVTTSKPQVAKQAASVLENLTANFNNAQDLARQFWFAGLGLMGRSVDEIQDRANRANKELQDRYSKINQESQKLVKDLVERGEQVQGDAESLIKQRRADIEQQIETAKNRAKNRFGNLASVVDIPARLQDMSDRLEDLSKDLKKTA